VRRRDDELLRRVYERLRRRYDDDRDADHQHGGTDDDGSADDHGGPDDDRATDDDHAARQRESRVRRLTRSTDLRLRRPAAARPSRAGCV
jgi:hypothetical protein